MPLRVGAGESLSRAGESTLEKTNFFQFINARTVLHEPGRVVQQVDVRPEFLQILGVVHGGIIAALIDDALGEAMNAMLDMSEEIALTAQLSVTFLASCREGRLTVEARIVKKGGTTGYGEATVTRSSPEGDVMVARGNALLIRKRRRPENPGAEQIQAELDQRKA